MVVMMSLFMLLMTLVTHLSLSEAQIEAMAVAFAQESPGL